MKIIVTAIIVCLFAFSASAEGMEFHHGTWAEALALSKESGKLIFMDAFTTWCGPCKKMSAMTFPQKEVGDFFNTNFINVKMDMEKGDGLMISGTYSVNAYPTLLFIDGEGQLVMKAVGALDAGSLIEAGKSALKKNDKSDFYAKEYSSGKKDFATIYHYVRALNLAGKSSTKIANEYLNTQKDLDTPDNLKFLNEAFTETDSRIFDLFVKHKNKLNEMLGSDNFKKKIITAANKTVNKAIEFKTPDLLASSTEKVKSYVPDQADAFEFEGNLKYYSSTSDAEGLLKSMKKLPSSIEKNAAQMEKLALAIERSFAKDSKLLSLAEKSLSQSIKDESMVSQEFTLVRILALNNKLDKAEKLLEETISKAKQNNQDTTPLEQYRLLMVKS